MKGNQNIKVGIIIPAYNVENYLFRALDSCINQTYRNIEVIVMDDGSSDGTYAVAKSYSERDPRVKAFKQKNAGVSAARNNAIDMCCADHLLFLDSDDWLEENAVSDLLQHLPDGEGKYLICCDTYYAYMEEQGIRRVPADGVAADKCGSAEELLMYTAKSEYKLRSACYKLFSLRIIRECALKFREDIRHGEDGLFVFEYLKHSDAFVYFPGLLWNILERPGSATTSPYNRSWLSAVTAAEAMLAYDNSPELHCELKKYLVQRTTTTLCCALASVNADKKDIAYLRRLLRGELGFYMKNEKSLKRRLFYLFESFAPVFAVRAHCSRKG